ncbi:PREDICTED: ras-related protein Rab-22A [Chaetura pelagica]|uniref:ras-related protein Rab-22A n=1 Tax=Chaetura pelagica TaxID=8897 RepID=UPI00052335B2|nr:PREDICTED: ras-related protein Rab-22A [Chaetura pelagica]
MPSRGCLPPAGPSSLPGQRLLPQNRASRGCRSFESSAPQAAPNGLWNTPGFENVAGGGRGRHQDTGVGKSSIVWRFVEDSFDPNINPTIGASFMTKTVQYQNELHKFLIWDTAGQERFRALAPMYYRGSAAAIIVYDITKEETFSTLKNWVKELRQHGPPNIVVAIAGNKCDLNDVREVMEKDAKDYADSIHAIFVETSAKNAININELFIEISRRIPSTDTNPPSSGKGFKLRRQPSVTKRSCC